MTALRSTGRLKEAKTCLLLAQLPSSQDWEVQWVLKSPSFMYAVWKGCPAG